MLRLICLILIISYCATVISAKKKGKNKKKSKGKKNSKSKKGKGKENEYTDFDEEYSKCWEAEKVIDGCLAMSKWLLWFHFGSCNSLYFYSWYTVHKYAPAITIIFYQNPLSWVELTAAGVFFSQTKGNDINLNNRPQMQNDTENDIKYHIFLIIMLGYFTIQQYNGRSLPQVGTA